MKRILSFLIACSTCQAKSLVNEELVHKVAIIESNVNPDAVGDGGESLGAFQIKRAAWADAVAYSRMVAGPHEYTLPEDWKGYAKDYEMSFRAAYLLLQMYVQRMIKNKVKPTPIKLYMAYNLGYNGASAHNFDIDQTWGVRRAILLRAKHILAK